MKSNRMAAGLFEKAFHYFQFNQEEYMDRYRKRSNVESTFSAVKRKFGDSVMIRIDAGMVNEVLCKVLCHNLACLIQEQETLGITPIFWKDEQLASLENRLYCRWSLNKGWQCIFRRAVPFGSAPPLCFLP